MADAQAHAAHDSILLPLPRLSVHGRQRRLAEAPAANGGLSAEQISALLWAGFGLDRRGSGGRTPVPLHQRPELDVYVLLPEGSYLYDAREHRLELVSARDLRHCAGRHAAVQRPALVLVYTTDCDGLSDDVGEECGILACANARCIAEGIGEYCGSAGLASGLRHAIDGRLARELALKNTQQVVLAQAVGFAPAAH